MGAISNGPMMGPALNVGMCPLPPRRVGQVCAPNEKKPVRLIITLDSVLVLNEAAVVVAGVTAAAVTETFVTALGVI